MLVQGKIILLIRILSLKRWSILDRTHKGDPTHCKGPLNSSTGTEYRMEFHQKVYTEPVHLSRIVFFIKDSPHNLSVFMFLKTRFFAMK